MNSKIRRINFEKLRGGGYKYVQKKVFFRIKKNIYIETNKYDFIKAFYIM